MTDNQLSVEARAFVAARLADLVPLSRTLPEPNRGRTSVHEAGHAVAMTEAKVDVDGIEGGAAGKAVPVGGVEALVEQDPEGALFIALAGVVAERLWGETDVNLLSDDCGVGKAAIDRLGLSDEQEVNEHLGQALHRADELIRREHETTVRLAQLHGAANKFVDGASIRAAIEETWKGPDQDAGQSD